MVCTFSRSQMVCTFSRSQMVCTFSRSQIYGLHFLSFTDGLHFLSFTDGLHFLPFTDGLDFSSFTDGLHFLSFTDGSHVLLFTDGSHVLLFTDGSHVPSFTDGLHVPSFTEMSSGEHPEEIIDWGGAEHRHSSISKYLKLKLRKYPAINTNYMLHHCAMLQHHNISPIALLLHLIEWPILYAPFDRPLLILLQVGLSISQRCP